MDSNAEHLEHLKDQLARAERNVEKFRLLGDQERYLQSYFLAESLGTQLDAVLADEPSSRYCAS